MLTKIGLGFTFATLAMLVAALMEVGWPEYMTVIDVGAVVKDDVYICVDKGVAKYGTPQVLCCVLLLYSLVYRYIDWTRLLLQLTGEIRKRATI